MSEVLKPSIMRKNRFSDSSPGRLVPASLVRKRTTGSGLIEFDSIPSFAFVPNALPPKIDWRLFRGDLYHHFEAATAALNRVNGLVPLAPNTQILRQALWLREAKISSEMEDIHTNALDMIMAGSGTKGVYSSVIDEGLEAWNAMLAVRKGLESDLPFSSRLIKEMHQVLLAGTRGEEKRPGVFRSSQAYIGSETKPENARFVPPPPGEMPDGLVVCMNRLEQFANTEWAEIPKLAQVAMMHYQFETIHPFNDGNGRIGRALIIHQLCQKGLLDLPVVFVSGYLKRHQQEYVDRLFAVSADGDWLGWIQFFVDAVAAQAVQTRILAERLIRTHREYTEKLRELGTPARMFTLIDHLFDWPVVTAKSVAELLGVSNPTARKDISALEKIGVLRITENVRWGKAWFVPAIIGVIEATDAEIESEISG